MRPPRLLLLALCLAGLALPAGAADLGALSLPTFAWPPVADEARASRWEGSFARASTGFVASSSRHFGGYAGPTIGFEGGRMWREGAFVYGIVGGFDYLQPIAGYGAPRFGQLAYSRDFAGALQLKAGALVADDVLVYAKAGGAALNERWRLGPTAISPPLSRSDLVVRPDARVGVEWAVTDRLSVAVEAGVTGARLR